MPRPASASVRPTSRSASRSAKAWISDFSVGGVLDGANDAADRGVEPEPIDAHVDLAVLHDGGGEHGVARAALDRQRLAGHRLLVDQRFAADHAFHRRAAVAPRRNLMTSPTG